MCRRAQFAGLTGVLLALASAVPLSAGIFGVPTDLDAAGAPTGATVDPPGWFTLTGTDSSNADGDTVHNIRFQIEVTGTTLDVRVFDPGNSGARDLVRDGDTETRFRLFDPAGNLLSRVDDFGNDNGTTQNRLVRFTPPCGGAPDSCGFFTLNSASANNVPFTGLSPGLYEFRVEMRNGDDDVNAFGLDVRDAAGNHYNVFDHAAGNRSMPAGALDSGGTPANITPPLIFFPYVNRGCTVQTSNFDMDTGAGNPGAGSSATTTDVLGAVAGLTMSGGTVHTENTVTVESTAATNLESINYGMFELSNDLAPVTQQNIVDWRVADFQGWTNNPGGTPRTSASPIRFYLPNGYAPVVGDANATAPPEPTLSASARVVSGANPPAVGMTTRFLITATVENCAARNAVDSLICDVPSNTSTNVQITIPIVAGATYVAGSQAGFVDGVASACVDGSGAGFRRCTFAALGAGSAATLNVEVDVTPGAAGLQNLTGAPAAGAPPPNTTVWAQYTPASSSLLFPRTETLGPVCNLVIDVGGGALATRATLRGLRVDPAAGLVEFATGSQRETVAFRVYFTDDPTGRRRTLLTRLPIRAPVPSSLTPVTYRAQTAPFAAPYVVLEEVDARGRRHVMGPFPVGDARLRAAFDAVERRLDAAGATRVGSARAALGRGATALAAAAPVRSSAAAPVASTGRIRIDVSRAGPVEVPLADLEAWGLPPSVSAGSLRLRNFGRRVAFQVSGGVLRFTGEALSTDYTGANAYVLSWGASVPTPSARLTVSEEPKAPTDVRVQRNVLYVPNVPEDADPWVWDLLFGDGSTWPYDYDPAAGDFDLPGLAPGATGNVGVRVRLVGRSQNLHAVEAAVNGVSVGRLVFEGAVPAVLTGTVPAEVLQPAGNRLTLTYSAAATDPDDLGLVYLSALDLAAPVAPAGPAPADRLDAYDPSLPSTGRTEYLVVTHPDFRAQAERIAAVKEGEGLATTVVDVGRLYDRFSAGIVEADAIRQAIRTVAGNGRLRYVLLVGGDTFDTHDYLGTGAVSSVPSLLAWDGEFGRVPSENLYADVDGDGAPEVAIGRLPVRTADEASVLADKIERAATSLHGARQTHLFAVDNQGPSDEVSFRAAAEQVASRLGVRRPTIADVAQGVAAARATLLSGLAQGAFATHYFGHGGPEVWADEALLTVDDVPALAGTGGRTVLFAWACEAQWYQNLFGPSVNEALLLVPDGGAMAAFGPAGATDPALQSALYDRVYAPWLRGATLGEAIRRAKAQAIRDPATRPVVEGWNLLGDPALPAPSPSPRF